MAKNDNLQWLNVDVSTFTPSVAKAYKAYKDHAAITRQKREEFENLFRAVAVKGGKLPEGTEPVFSYKFGKLSIAHAPVKAAKAKPGNFSL